MLRLPPLLAARSSFSLGRKDLSLKLFIVLVAALLVVASMAAEDGRAHTHGGSGLSDKAVRLPLCGGGLASSRDPKRELRPRPQGDPHVLLDLPLPPSPTRSGHGVHRGRLPLHRASAAGRRWSRALHEARTPGISPLESLTRF